MNVAGPAVRSRSWKQNLYGSIVSPASSPARGPTGKTVSGEPECRLDSQGIAPVTSRRSYLDTLNAGRQRRPAFSNERLDRSLDLLDEHVRQMSDALREEDERDVGETENLGWMAREVERAPSAALLQLASQGGLCRQACF